MKESDKLDFKEKRNLAIKAGINAIPYIGSSLSTIYYDAKQEKRFKRIENFYYQIKQEFEQFKNNVKPFEWQDSDKDNISSLLEEIMEGIENDFIESKMTFFKNCFFNILTTPTNSSYHKRKYLISIINMLSDFDIKQIIELYKENPDGRYRPNDKQINASPEFYSSMEKLKSFGLISSYVTRSPIAGLTWNHMTSFTLSEFGIEFCNFCLENEKEKILK